MWRSRCRWSRISLTHIWSFGKNGAHQMERPPTRKASTVRQTKLTISVLQPGTEQSCRNIFRRIFFLRFGQTRNHKRNSKQTNGLVLFVCCAHSSNYCRIEMRNPMPQKFSEPFPYARFICIYIHFVIRYCVTCVANCFILLRHIDFRSQFSSSFILYAGVVACVRVLAAKERHSARFQWIKAVK